MDTMLRLVVADDHPIVHAGLGAVLSELPACLVVGRPQTFAATLDLLAMVSADLLVLDLAGMGETPLTMVARLRQLHPGLPLLVFSSSADLAPELIQAGVRGYVLKDEVGEHLVAAVRAVAAGRRYFSPLTLEYLDRSSFLRRTSQLTEQEFGVLELLAAGLSTVQIGAALGLDPRTVQNYITQLRRKTGCQERTQLAAWFERRFKAKAV